ncbi:MAG: YCF48-related protein [Bacteroidota bacterium]
MRHLVFFALISLATQSFGQRLVKEIYKVDNIYSLGDKVIVVADDGLTGNELWISDGTSDGTHLIKELYPGNQTGVAGKGVVMNGTLYFPGYSPKGIDLWKTDGTADGTVVVKDLAINGGSLPMPLFALNNNLYFFAYENNWGLYKTDGTDAGTTFIRQVDSALPSFTSPSSSYVYQSNYFTTPISRVDGTTVTNLTIPDLGGDQVVYKMAAADGGLFVMFRPSIYDYKLYYYSEASGNFQFLKEFTDVGDPPVNDFVTSNGKLFFALRKSGYYNFDTWVSDGTVAGTTLLRSSQGSLVASFFPYKNGVVFEVSQAQSPNDNGLWFSDGTVNGTISITSQPFYHPFSNEQSLLTAIKGDFYYWSSNNRIISSNATSSTVNMDYPFPRFGVTPYRMIATNKTIFIVDNLLNKYQVWTLDPSPLITISGFFGDINTDKPASLDYYHTTRVDSCNQSYIDIYNSGLSDLHLSGLSFSNPDWYLNSTVLPEVITPGDHSRVDIVFNPIAEGERIGNLNIRSDDATNHDLNIKFIGLAKDFAKFGCYDSTGKVKEIHATPSHNKLLLSSAAIKSDAAIGTVVGSFSLKDESGAISYSLVDDANANNNLFSIDGSSLKTNIALNSISRNVATVHVKATRADLTKVDDVFVINISGSTTVDVPLTCWSGMVQMNYGISSVAINSLGDFFAAGNQSRIIYSKDKGTTWNEAAGANAAGYVQQFTRIEFVGKLGIAYGYYSNVYVSSDNGYTWSMIGIPPSGDALRTASFSDELHGFGVDALNKVWKTVDGGKNWTGGWQLSYSNFNAAEISAADENTFAYSDDLHDNNFYKSSDGGKTIVNIQSPGPVTKDRLRILSPTNWLLLTSASLYETTNAGALWYKKGDLNINQYDPAPNFVDVTGDNITIVVPWESGVVYNSIDRGQTWTIIGYGKYLVALQGDNGIASTRPFGYTEERVHQLVVTTNGGTDWQDSNITPDANFSTLTFSSATTAYVSVNDNYSSQTIKTIDGGLSWKPVFTDQQFSGIYFKDPSTAFGTNAGGLYKTTNGGTNWHKVNSEGGNRFVFFGDHGVFMGAHMWWTDNGGESWTSSLDIFGAGGGEGMNMFFVNQQVGYMTRRWSEIYKTIDGGKTWTSIWLHGSGIDYRFSGILFFDELNGWVGGENGTIYTTTDGGTTWDTMDTELPGVVAEIYKRSSGEILAASAVDFGYYTLWSSKDGGAHFTQTDVLGNVFSFVFTDETIYIAGADNLFLKHVSNHDPAPSPLISGPAVACVDESVQFFVSTPGVATEWTLSGAGTISSNDNHAEVSASQAGQLQIGVRVNMGCGFSDYSYATLDVRSLDSPVINGPLKVDSIHFNTYTIADKATGSWYGWSTDAFMFDVAGDTAKTKWRNQGEGYVQLVQRDLTSSCRATALLKITVGDRRENPGGGDGEDPGGDGGNEPLGLETANNISVYPNPATGPRLRKRT